MEIGDIRKCDVCQSEVPTGQIFRQVKLRPEFLDLFLCLPDPDLQPSWRFVKDGSGQLQLDICLDCTGNMGSGLKGIESQ